MSGERVALDTSRAIDILNGVAGASDWVDAFDEILLPVTVIGELLFGATNSRRPDDNRRSVEDLISHCVVLSAQPETARRYADIRSLLKRKGRPIPENDLWIAAACLEHGVALATHDAHFAEVDGLVLRQD